MTRLQERINPETGKPFASMSEYAQYRARQRINPDTGEKFKSLIEYETYMAKKLGFASYKQYQESLIKRRVNPSNRKKFKSSAEYEQYIRRRLGFKNFKEYAEHWARQKTNPETGKPFESFQQYKTHKEKQKKSNRKYKEFAELVNRRLEWIGVDEEWLAEKMNVPTTRVYAYSEGRRIPHGRNLRILLSALEIKKLPKGLEDLVEE